MTSQKKHAGDFSRPETLTAIEIQYLAMIAEGNHPSSIAKSANISEADVQAVLNSVREKLGATNLLNAVSVALLKGIIQRDI